MPRKSYKDRFALRPHDILHYVEKKFIKKVLLPEITSTCRDKKVMLESGTDKDRMPPKSLGKKGEGEEGSRNSSVS